MATDYNSLISMSYGIEAASQVGGALMQAEALRAQGQFQQTMAQINQQFANRKADQVEKMGSEQANLIHRRAQGIQGAQRASAAAQGIRVDDGSAGDAVDQTREMSVDDQITTRNNAWREAFGIRTQAAMGVSQAAFQRRANNNAAQGTLLGGVLQGASTGVRATGYGLKAFRDQPTERTDLLSLPSEKADTSGYENKYFDDIFGVERTS